MEDFISVVGGKSVTLSEDVAKISIVGAGMESHAGVATKMFEALFDAQINADDADKAVSAIHSKFFD